MPSNENYELELHIEGGGADELTLDVTPQPTVTLQLGTAQGDPDGISARNAEAWAVGKRNGVPVGPSDPTYHNNSKWYSDQVGPAVTNFPYIDNETGNWMVYDTVEGAYVDTGVAAQGPAGADGQDGRDGEGVPTGGTAGQVLRKVSGTDYDTEWAAEQDITGKADKVSSATDGNFAALDANGNLTDSGHKHGDYVTDVSDKADKVTGATDGNFAALDSNGNLTDSGHKHSDYLTSHQDISGKVDQNEVANVEAGSTASRSYAVGEILWRSGVPYQVILAIASGDAFSSSNISTLSNGIANALAVRTNSVATDLGNLDTTVDQIADEVDGITGDLALLCIAGESTAITGNGTQTISCEGLTQDHRVVNWGLTVGSPSDPPATIEITEAAGEYTVAVTRYGGTSFYIRPVFILPQNLS